MSSGRLFYGWRIVGVAFLAEFVVVGFFFYSYGVLLKPLAAELGDGSLTGVSLGVPVASVAGALIAPFLGRALDRHPIRPFMLAGVACFSIGFLLLSRIESLWQLYLLLATFVALGMGLLGGLASSKLVANWFVARRGRALGVASVGVSLSGVVMPGAATLLVAGFGWRGAFAAFGAGTLLLIPVVARFVVNRPEDMGLRPDGEAHPPAAGALPAEPEAVWRTRQLFRSGNFWAIALAFSLTFGALSAVLIHLVPRADDLGLTASHAAALAGVAAGAGALGKLFFGRLFDRVGARRSVWLSFGLQLAGLLLLIQSASVPALLGAVLIFGFGMGGVVPLQGAVTGAAFGRLSFGKALGLMRPVQMPIQVVGVPLAAWIHDATGSYDGAYWIFAAGYLAACAVVGALRLEGGTARPEPISS